MRELFPEGFDDIRDLPHGFFDMLRMATTFLGFEEMPEDERPDRKIWLDAPKLTEHFNEVRRAREEKYGTRSDRDQEIEDPVQNEAAKGLRG